MKTHSLNAKGFGAVEVLLALVVLVVVAAGGAYVYHKDHKTKAPVSSSTGTTSTSKTGKTSTSSKPATTQGTYLDLTQEGVKFLLTDSVSDAVYAPYVSPVPGSAVYGLSTQKLQNAGGKGDCTAAYGPLGTISVSTTPPKSTLGPNPGDTPAMTPDNKTVFLIGGKYYHYEPPQDTGMCNSFSDAETATYQQAIAQSFMSLQADN